MTEEAVKLKSDLKHTMWLERGLRVRKKRLEVA